MVYNLDVRKLRKVFIALVAVAVLCLALLTVGCDKATERIYNKGYSDTVDYSVGILENGYEIEILNVDGYRLYQPKANTEWVFVFYLGTAMSTDNYDAILSEVATHGISVVVPNDKFADVMYSKTEKAYGMFDCEKYILGGHSQGGGAAIRRAGENMQTTKACVLYSPMLAPTNGTTLADSELPVIFFEAENDKILSSSNKSEAKSRMNGLCEYVMLEGANHMCYGESNMISSQDGVLERTKEEIQTQVAQLTIEFLDNVIKAEQA